VINFNRILRDRLATLALLAVPRLKVGSPLRSLANSERRSFSDSSTLSIALSTDWSL